MVRADAAPAGSEGLIAEAVAEVSAATGLTFVADGTTAEPPSAERDLFQPGTYGKRWVPVLLTWSGPAEVPELAGDVIGPGGSDYARTPGQPLVYVGGQMRLDAVDAAATLALPRGRDHIRATIAHELAHVVGLDHVDDPTQLMYAENSGVSAFGDGDRAGLAVLRAGPCVPGS